MNHSVSDFIIRIKNSALARRHEVDLPYSNINKAIGKVLQKEGFLEEIKETKNGNIKELHAVIAYEKRSPVLGDVRIVSKPSLRIYKGVKELPYVMGGLGIAIISTPKGVMSDKEARKIKVGGEVLALVW